jgi:hypothetical protein
LWRAVIRTFAGCLFRARVGGSWWRARNRDRDPSDEECSGIWHEMTGESWILGGTVHPAPMQAIRGWRLCLGATLVRAIGLGRA